MRKCCQCGRDDHEIPTPDGVQHFVVPEIRYIKDIEELTPRLMRLGWRGRAAFQGREAIERMICVECLNANDLRDRVWGQMREDARRLEKKSTSDEEYYAVLCEA